MSSTKISDNDKAVQEILKKCITNDQVKANLTKSLNDVQNEDNKNYFIIISKLLSERTKGLAMTYDSDHIMIRVGANLAKILTNYYELMSLNNYYLDINNVNNSNKPTKNEIANHDSRRRKVLINLVSMLVSLVLSYHTQTSEKYLNLKKNSKYEPSGLTITELIGAADFRFMIDSDCLMRMLGDVKEVRKIPLTYIFDIKKLNKQALFRGVSIRPCQNEYMFKYFPNKCDEEGDTPLSSKVLFLQKQLDSSLTLSNLIIYFYFIL